MSELQQFVWEHRDDDPVQLALSAKKYPGIPMGYVARQVEALGRLRRKIPSWYRPGLELPVALSLEQASSEATARFKASLFSGRNIADLTGGLGVDASFFAEHFDSVCYVERIPEILTAARHNLGVLGQANIVFVEDQAEAFLAATEQTFDLLYLDPARRDNRKGKVFQLADCSPNVLEIKDLMLKHAPKILIKTAPLLDIHEAIRQLGHVSRVWVVEHDGDCREVLYLLERDVKAQAVPITAVAVDKEGNTVHTFSFSVEEEQQSATTFSAPEGYLYEPVTAVLKAGAFKTFSKRFNINKLHANTHLYTSDSYLQGLPARAFRIEAVCKYDRKAVEACIPGGKANVSTRNFPDSPDQVRKKLGLQDGGNTYVFAATDDDEKKLILVCSKV